jgi:hypothetical protein
LVLVLLLNTHGSWSAGGSVWESSLLNEKKGRERKRGKREGARDGRRRQREGEGE